MQEEKSDDIKSESDLNDEQSSDDNIRAPPPPDRVFIYSKGAPDEILKICDQIFVSEDCHYDRLDIQKIREINNKVTEMQKEFLKVVMFSLR